MNINIKLVCFDLNKTLINENTWYDLNLAMGITAEEDQEMFKRWSSGKLSYVAWQKELERLYITRGKATKERIICIINQYSYATGAQTAITDLQKNGYQLSLISGSIDLLVKKVADELKIPLYSANNSFTFDVNGYLSAINCLGEDNEVKVIQLQDHCQELGIDITQVACVGDGDNDQEIFTLTGHGITFKGSKIESDAWKVINNLKEISTIL